MRETTEQLTSLDVIKEITSFSSADEGKTFLKTRPLGSLTCNLHVSEGEITDGSGYIRLGVASTRGLLLLVGVVPAVL